MTARRLVVVLLFLAIFSFGLARETDFDFWWHLRAGELTAQTGQIPAADQFSFTAYGQPWVAHEWLWELGAYHLYQRGGFVLLVLLSATILTCTYAILYHLLRRLGANERVAAVLVLGAAALGAPNMGVRPRELTFLFLSVYLHRLVLHREGFTSRLWPLPLLMLLWVNVHGGFALGLGLLALFGAGSLIEAVQRRPFYARAAANNGATRAWTFDLGPWTLSVGPRLAHLLAAALTTVCAAMLNPSGPRMLLYPFGYYSQSGNPSFSVVTEFQSPDFHQPLMFVFAGGLLVFLGLGIRRGRPNLVEWLTGAAFVLQALLSERQVGICAMVMAPLLVLSLRERYAWARELPPFRQPRRLIVVNWVLLGMVVAAAVLSARRPPLVHKLQLGAQPGTRTLPVAGAQFIDDHGLPDPIFNSQPWGGYLIYRWFPQRRVFIDGRIDMYGSDITAEYLQVVTVKPQWRAVLDKHGIQTLLIGQDSALSVLLLADGGWERVFHGDVEDVFVRRRVAGTEPGAGAPRQPDHEESQ